MEYRQPTTPLPPLPRGRMPSPQGPTMVVEPGGIAAPGAPAKAGPAGVSNPVISRPLSPDAPPKTNPRVSMGAAARQVGNTPVTQMPGRMPPQGIPKAPGLGGALGRGVSVLGGGMAAYEGARGAMDKGFSLEGLSSAADAAAGVALMTPNPIAKAVGGTWLGAKALGGLINQGLTKMGIGYMDESNFAPKQPTAPQAAPPTSYEDGSSKSSTDIEVQHPADMIEQYAAPALPVPPKFQRPERENLTVDKVLARQGARVPQTAEAALAMLSGAKQEIADYNTNFNRDRDAEFKAIEADKMLADTAYMPAKVGADLANTASEINARRQNQALLKAGWKGDQGAMNVLGKDSSADKHDAKVVQAAMQVLPKLLALNPNMDYEEAISLAMSTAGQGLKGLKEGKSYTKVKEGVPEHEEGWFPWTKQKVKAIPDVYEWR